MAPSLMFELFSSNDFFCRIFSIILQHDFFVRQRHLLLLLNLFVAFALSLAQPHLTFLAYPRLLGESTCLGIGEHAFLAAADSHLGVLFDRARLGLRHAVGVRRRFHHDGAH